MHTVNAVEVTSCNECAGWAGLLYMPRKFALPIVQILRTAVKATTAKLHEKPWAWQ